MAWRWLPLGLAQRGKSAGPSGTAANQPAAPANQAGASASPAGASARWPDDREKYRMLDRLRRMATAGVVCIAIYAAQFYPSRITILSVFGVGVLAAGASLLSGFLLGFLFGIPRTPKDAASGQAGGTTTTQQGADGGDTAGQRAKNRLASVETNSNLVEISDWLTKILVGVGLVELSKIPGKMEALAGYVSKGLRGCEDPALAGYMASGLQACKDSVSIDRSHAAALAIIVFFFAAGFLIAYLWVRLYFQRALEELANEADRVEDIWKDIFRAKTAFDASHLDEAKRLIEGVLRTEPFNVTALTIKGAILSELAVALGPPDKEKLLQDALTCASQVVKLRPEAGGSYYNRACYTWLLKDNTAVDEVTKDLKRAFELDSTLRAYAKDDSQLVEYRKTSQYADLMKPPGS
jgi:hypothetical protein